MKKIVMIIMGLAVMSLAGAAVCLAEPAKRDQAKAKKLLGDVTVTAGKVESNIGELPQSITVLTGKEIEQADIRNMRELTQFTPNVYMAKSTSENMINIRGITAFDTSIYSPTAVYVDDLLVPLHYAHNLDLVDVERVEVLRGPQGSLYGGNSLAGVINVITRKPDEQARAHVSGGLNLYPDSDSQNPGYSLSAGASGPVVKDRLYLGVSGQIDINDGFVENLYNDNDKAGSVDHKNARATLRWTPKKNLEVMLTGDVYKNDDGIGVYRFATGPYRTERHKVRMNTDNFQVEDANSQILRVSYAANAFDFVSITGRRDYKNNNLQDYDNTADPYYDWGSTMADYDDTFYSQEFRLSSKAGNSPFKWLLGLYGMTEDSEISQINQDIQQNAVTTIDKTNYALFGESTYTFGGRLHLTAGLRLDASKLEGKKTDTGISISDDSTENEVLPKFSVSYDVTDNDSVYAVVSRGYLSGGYNYGMALDKESFTYGPEYTWNYEVGAKTAWLDRKLFLNLAFFYIQMQDKQAFDMVITSSANPVTKVENAAEAHSMGFELELQAKPAEGWDITAGFGLTDAEYDDWVSTEWNSDYTALVNKDYSGKQIIKVPEYNGHLGVQYRHPSGFFGRADLNYIGGMYVDSDNKLFEDPYSLLGLRFGYETDSYSVVLWGKNVFDTEYNAVAYDWDGAKLVQDGDPVMVGLTLTARF